MEQGILDDAAQIAVPAFVSTLCICIVFVPMFLLTGVARYLFVPLAREWYSQCSHPMLFSTLVRYFRLGHQSGHDAAAPRTIFGRMSELSKTASTVWAGNIRCGSRRRCTCVGDLALPFSLSVWLPRCCSLLSAASFSQRVLGLAMG